MSISYDGALVVGNHGKNIPRIFEDSYWIDGNGLRVFSPHFDAPPEEGVIGFEIPNIHLRDMTEAWLLKINDLGVEFEKITGCEAMLIGTQDIC